VQSVESLLSGATSNQLWHAWNLQQSVAVYHTTRKAESFFTPGVGRNVQEIIHISRRMNEQEYDETQRAVQENIT
jgi:hypothetical protein